MWLKYKFRRLFFRAFVFLYSNWRLLIRRPVTKNFSIKKFFNIVASYKNDYCLKINNNKFYYDPSTDIGELLYLSGQFEDKEISYCKNFIYSDSVVLDIGANIGLHSVYFSTMAQDGTIVSFEPSHTTFARLCKNVEKNKNIFPLNVGLSDSSGFKSFYEATDNAYSGLKDTKRKSLKCVSRILCYKVDQLVANVNFGKIDFVKIDVEGSEQDVIVGMHETIKKYKPVIFCEIYQGTNSNPDPNLTINTILKYGYVPYVLKEGDLVTFEKHEDNNHNYFFIPIAN